MGGHASLMVCKLWFTVIVKDICREHNRLVRRYDIVIFLTDPWVCLVTAARQATRLLDSIRREYRFKQMFVLLASVGEATRRVVVEMVVTITTGQKIEGPIIAFIARKIEILTPY